MEESTTVNALRAIVVSVIVVLGLLAIMASSQGMGQLESFIEAFARGDWSSASNAFMMVIVSGLIAGSFVTTIVAIIIEQVRRV